MTTVLGHIRRLVAAQTASDRPDQQLLRRFAVEGDEAAFEALLRRHGPMVLGVCRRVLDCTQDVEDAFQATFVVLARKAATIRKPESVGSWLHGVAFRIARQIKAATRPGAALTAEGPPVDADPLGELTWREVRVAMDEELQRLPLKYRAPLLLCYLEGCTQDEAARQLGWSKSTLRRRLDKGRELLKGRLTRRGLTLSVALFGVILTPTRAASALPPALSASTLRAVQAVAGKTADGVGAMSPRVLASANQLSHALLVAKVKAAVWVILALGLAAVGAVLGARPLWTSRPEQAYQAALPPATAMDTNSDRPSEQPVRTDALGDPLPDGVRLRLGTSRLSPGSFIHSCVFSPDGQTLFAGGEEGVFAWQLATGQTIRCLEGHHRRVFPVAISPDGRTLVSAGLDGTILRWDARTGEKLGRLVDQPHKVFNLVYSPDGRTLASGGMDGVVRFWDAADGKERGRLETMSGGNLKTILSPIAFLPDNRTLVLQQWDRRIALWDSAFDARPRPLEWLPRGLSALALARDGKALALARDDRHTIVVYDLATEKPLGEFHGHHGTIDALAFSPDGRTLASHATDRTVRLWQTATGQELRRMRTDSNHARLLKFSPDGRLLADGSDTSIRLWDVATGRERFTYQGHRGGVKYLAFADGQTLFTVGGDDTARHWDVGTGGHLGYWQGPAGRDVWAVALSPRGQVLASGDSDGTVLLQDRRTGKEIRAWDAASSRITALAFAPDKRTLATAGFDSTLVLWDTTTGREVRRFEEYAIVRSLAFSPDGRLLAAGYRDGSLWLWELATGKAVHPFAGVRTSLEALAFSPDGKMLAGVADQPGLDDNPEALTLWEVATGQVRWQWAAQGHRRWCVAFSPDGKVLASGGADRLVRLWDLATGDELPTLPGHHGPIDCVAFSPDGQTLASGSEDTTVLLWDAAHWRPRKPHRSEALTPAALQALWADLARPDARQAYQAIRTLAAAPDQAISLLQRRLRSGSGQEGLGREIRMGLREAADIGPDARERRRTLRAIEVLEQIATPAARQLLRGLADEAGGEYAAEARSALARLAKRTIAPP